MYCRLHIERNIIKQIKINNIKDLIQYFRDFLNEKMDKKEYIDKLNTTIILLWCFWIFIETNEFNRVLSLKKLGKSHIIIIFYCTHTHSVCSIL